ncbi:MAG: carboxylating nicotinate-nucleotide diphosphorylase [Planctomycetes bacterium]|nr:carboxylating nicotinate-nucleotide diphosphorylase [Planctomycetota bacterium]
MLDLNALSLAELFDTLTADGSLRRLATAARDEDLAGVGDITTSSLVSPQRMATASVTGRAAGVVAGLRAVPAVLEAFGGNVACECAVDDGDAVAADTVLATLSGALSDMLAVERTLLNLVGRLCGVATVTRSFVDAIAGTRAVICDTRKTTPGLRSLEKYAVRCGGATLHRVGLHDAALYKDNHLAHVPPDALPDALTKAIGAVRDGRDIRFVEVEVDTTDQLRDVLGLAEGLVDLVLLDNMSLGDLADAVALRDATAPRIGLEASGGVTGETVTAIAATGVDRISVGALTHGACSLDVGLDIA